MSARVELPRLGSQARLVLDVALPRLARNSGRMEQWLRGYTPEHRRQSMQQLVGLPGSEGLAVLASLSPAERAAVLGSISLSPTDKASLDRLSATLGDATDAGSPARALAEAFPALAELRAELEGDASPPRDAAAGRPPAQQDSGARGPEARPSDEAAEAVSELAHLATVVQTWPGDEEASDALLRLARATLEHGGPLPPEFWLEAARRVSEMAAPPPRLVEVLEVLARMVRRIGDGALSERLVVQALAVLEDRRQAAIADKAVASVGREGEASRDEIQGRIALNTVTLADLLARRGEPDQALRVLAEVLPAVERLGDVRGLLVCRANIAVTLLLRMAETGDRAHAPRANELLCLALAAARRLRLPEAGQIERILGQAGMTCPQAQN